MNSTLALSRFCGLPRIIPKMNSICQIVFCFAFLCVITTHAQLAVTISSPKITGQKAVVTLAMTNNLAESVASACAVCFLLDDQGKLVSQSSKWVIGGTKDRPALKSKQGASFNFVMNSPQPFTTTNLTAKVSFSRIVLTNGKLADVRQTVIMTTQ